VNPYIFQVALAVALIIGAVIGTAKFILEVYGMPTISDEEWELEKAQRNDLG
jgi:hypothetical protein